MDKVNDNEILDLAIEFSKKYSHLDEDTHLQLVQYGCHWFGKDQLMNWYEKTVPLLKQEKVSDIFWVNVIFFYDSCLVPKFDCKPIHKYLGEKAI